MLGTLVPRGSLKEIEIEVDALDVDERLDLAEEKAREMIDNEEVVLTADDFSGTRLIELTDLDTGCYAGWFEA